MQPEHMTFEQHMFESQTLLALGPRPCFATTHGMVNDHGLSVADGVANALRALDAVYLRDFA